MSITACSWLHIASLLFLTVSGLAHSSKTHKCIHDSLGAEISHLHLPGEEHKTMDEMSPEKEKHRRRLGTVTFEPIRITFDISGLKGLEKEKYDFIVNSILPATKQFFESFLEVSPLTSPIIMDNRTCVNASVPSIYRTTGISDTDVLIFVTYDESSYDNYVAWAAVCKLSSKNNRPLAGQINFAADNIKPTMFDFRSTLQVVIHEMTHVLVFSKKLYPYYINSDGTTKTNVTQRANFRGISSTIITLPSVVEWVQEHFNCSSLQGAELENQGDSGSAGSHWERRVFANEIMGSNLADDEVFSGLTLALFEESGWYVVDKSKADSVLVGKGLGCSFVNTTCVENKKSNFPEYYCDTHTNGSACTYSYMSKGDCCISSSYSYYYSRIPNYFDYWNDGYTGSSDSFTDNCPFIKSHKDGSCGNPINHNIDDSKYIEEKYGPNSRCFEGTFLKSKSDKKYKNMNHAACLAASCSDGILKIEVGKQTIVCPPEGGKVYPNGYDGYITCPPAKDFCYRAYENQCGGLCGGIGMCFGGGCLCPQNVSLSECNPVGVTRASPRDVSMAGGV